MAKPISNLVIALAVLAFAPGSATASESSVEIRKFRFGKHKHNDFERLVLEFKKYGQPGDPTVQVKPEATGTQVVVGMDRINLSGVIPEAAINDSYTNRSSYLGPISINTDDPSHPIALRVFLKNTNLKVDAFWESRPPRLVVDAFPENSPRATKGRHIGGSRSIASAGGDSPTGVICFPANAQLLASVQFVEVSQPQKPLRFDTVNTKNGPVVCYPNTARVKAKVMFELKPGAVNQQGNANDSSQSAGLGLGGPFDRNPSALPDMSIPPPPDALPPPPPPPPGADDFGGERASGSTLNSNGFNPSTPLGSTLGDEGPTAPSADPSALLPPG